MYRQVLANGTRTLIYDPGEEEICHNCSRKGDCKEEIEISMPIRLGDEIIGVIGLVGSSIEQRIRILENEKMYLELLQGVLLMGKGDVITDANEAAMKQLSLKLPIGKRAVVTTTGDSLNHLNEYLIEIEGKSYSVMGHLYNLEGNLVHYSRVLIFESSKIVRKKYYELTNMVNPMGPSDIIGSSSQTLHLKKEIQKVAKSISTVLITGESGTGKELVATSIWKASDRKEKKFVAINCGAIPEPLLESELFGYEKGAFTGADPNGRMGKFELTNKGVMFLDEIGDMPLYLQVKLLRVLQERKITRIGSNQVILIDVRIIAATNKNLKEMIEIKEFREDLIIV